MRSNRTGWLMLAPSIFILMIVGVLPFIYVIIVGFHEWNTFAANPYPQWAGVSNYRRLVFDEDFLHSVRITLQFTFFAVASQLVIGYLLAQLLTRDFPGKIVFRVIHTIPLMVAPIAIGAVWRLLTIPGFGPVPVLLDDWFGFDYRIGTYGEQAFITTILMDIWHWTPFVTLTMLAGLTALPKEPLEQAQVDGANRFQVFFFITLPLMRPIILTTIFIRVMDALRVVDEVWMLAGGSDATRFVGIHIFRVVFPRRDFGYGSAMSLLVLYMTIVLCWILFVAMTHKPKER